MATVNLRRVVEQHTARRAKDPAVVMTSVMMVAAADGLARARSDNLTVALDADTMELLAYVRTITENAVTLFGAGAMTGGHLLMPPVEVVD